MARADLLGVLTWLRDDRQPLLVQVPAAELAHLLAASMPEAQELSDAVFGRLVRAIAEGDAGELAHLRSVGVITG